MSEAGDYVRIVLVMWSTEASGPKRIILSLWIAGEAIEFILSQMCIFIFVLFGFHVDFTFFSFETETSSTCSFVL